MKATLVMRLDLDVECACKLLELTTCEIKGVSVSKATAVVSPA